MNIYIYYLLCNDIVNWISLFHLALVFSNVAQFVTDVYDDEMIFYNVKKRFLGIFCLVNT